MDLCLRTTSNFSVCTLTPWSTHVHGNLNSTSEFPPTGQNLLPINIYYFSWELTSDFDLVDGWLTYSVQESAMSNFYQVYCYQKISSFVLYNQITLPAT